MPGVTSTSYSGILGVTVESGPVAHRSIVLLVPFRDRALGAQSIDEPTTYDLIES